MVATSEARHRTVESFEDVIRLEAEVIFRLKTWTHARGRWRMNADGQWWYNVVQRTLELTSGGSSHFLRTFQGSRSTFGRWSVEPTEPMEPTELTELWSSLPTGRCRS